LDKSSDAFRTISEVAGDLDLPQHVLRFWETRFAQIKPLKRGGGRRYYRPDDVDLLKGIRHLLYGEGYTIKGVQRILKDQGVRFVMTLWQEGAPALETALGGHRGDLGPAFDDVNDRGHQDPAFGDFDAGDDDSYGGEGDEEDQPVTGARVATGAVRSVPAPSPASDVVWRDDRLSPESMAHRFAPHLPDAIATESEGRRRAEPSSRETGAQPAAPQGRQPPFAPMIDRFRSVASRMSSDTTQRALGDAGTIAPAEGSGQGLSRDDVRRLQATLFELLECKRLLDQTR